jgi:cytochrome c biogenesis protein CcmG, thiol:disulfide interchange protein DsbE
MSIEPRVRPSRRRFAGVLLVAAALAAFVVFGLAGNGSPRRVAPALPSARLSGPDVTLGRLLGASRGRPTLVTFWASWCTPCQQEAPELERFALSASGRGRIVGVDFSEEAAPARTFVRRYSWTFANLRDAVGAVGNAYRLASLPTTFVIDSSGRIAGELRGPQTLASLTRAVAARA